MKPVIHLKRISDIQMVIQGVVKHPQVAVVDFAKIDEQIDEGTRISTDFYSIMFKNYCLNQIKYGRQSYDFQEGNLICIAPRQVITLDTEVEKREDKMGWGLFFHPDLIKGTSLAGKMKDYHFFSYNVTEALHLSEKEKTILFDCVQKIEQELQENIDSHSQTLIVSNIELLLNYCSRYYGRQFITRKNVNTDIVAQVEQLLHDYFRSEELKQNGLPSVRFLAEKVHLSPNYLSDLLKKETGKSAQDHIHYQLIEEAKTVLLHSNASVSEIAYDLGFEYTQYFSKLFKQKTGLTPSEYRTVN